MILRAIWVVVLGALATLALAQRATINRGDVLGVQVLRFEQLSGEYKVATDGSVSGSGFGVIQAEGKTLEEVRIEIRARIAKIVKDPEVFVTFVSQRVELVYVVGIAAEPVEGQEQRLSLPSGQFEWRPNMDVRSLLAGASLGTAPDRLQVSVFRGGTRIHVLDLGKLLDGVSEIWNGPLEAEDLLLIERKPTVRVWMVGEFRDQGEMQFPEGTTLEQAISLVGGIDLGRAPAMGNARADRTQIDQTRVRVRRGVEVFEFPAAPGRGEKDGFMLRTGDTVSVVVPEVVRVVLSGQVRNQGEIAVDATTSLFSLISIAGGVTPSGTLKGVLVFRGSEVFRFDLTTVLDGTPAAGFQIDSNDVVYVPQSEEYFHVVGEVARPGRVFIPDGTTLRASDALALVGGTSARGTLRRVILMRADSTGKFTPIEFNLDEFLKDGNIAANPQIQAGDVLLFGQPRGFTLETATQILTSILFLDTVFQRVND